MRPFDATRLPTVVCGDNVTPSRIASEIEVTLSGARLGDAKEIFYYQPGITTVSLARVDDNTIKAKLKQVGAS